MAGRDPWEAMKDLGPSRSLLGIAPWMLVAIATHTGAVISPQLTLMPMRRHVASLRSELRNHFGRLEVEVEREPPPDAAPTEPQPPPEAAPTEPEPPPETAPTEPEPERPAAPEPTDPKEAPPADSDPYAEEPPPAAAEAPDVLNAGEEDEAQDLGSWTMVHKEGSKSTGDGYSSREGTATGPVRDPRASSKGRPGGRGDGDGTVKPKAPSKPAVNRSKPAMPLSRNLSDCPFPPQADMAQVDRAVVDVTVTVDASGRPLGASVAGDPGYGFGSQAKRCALAMRYEPALDPRGDAIAGSTPTLRFRFNR